MVNTPPEKAGTPVYARLNPDGSDIAVKVHERKHRIMLLAGKRMNHWKPRGAVCEVRGLQSHQMACVLGCGPRPCTGPCCDRPAGRCFSLTQTRVCPALPGSGRRAASAFRPAPWLAACAGGSAGQSEAAQLPRGHRTRLTLCCPLTGTVLA